MTELSTQHMRFGSRTDIGSRRERNEDSLVVKPPLFAVADGMGGHNAGDVASEVAVNTLAALAPTIPDIDLLGQAVESANHAVITASRKAGCEGMGTTMTACVLRENKLAIAQAGDSRAYLLHAGKLQQVTRDHSLVADMVEKGQLTPEEARRHPNRSVITRALGNDPDMLPDLYEITASAGDRLLLCSDGLTSMVEDGDIQAILARVREPQQCVDALVREAISNGGADNVTVIVVDITGSSARAIARERRRGKRWTALVLIALALVVCGCVFGVFNWMQNAAYLSEVDGKVAVYRGIPDTIPGIETHWLVDVSDVDVDALQPGAQASIRKGLEVDNVEEAQRLVGEYQKQLADEASADESRGASDAASKASTASGGASVSSGASADAAGGAKSASAKTSNAAGSASQKAKDAQ